MKRIFIVLLDGIFVLIISSLIMWGIGNLVIYVFHINYTWTIGHGLASILFYWLLKEIFGKRGK